jgi:hypothetical protein
MASLMKAVTGKERRIIRIPIAARKIDYKWKMK